VIISVEFVHYPAKPAYKQTKIYARNAFHLCNGISQTTIAIASKDIIWTLLMDNARCVVTDVYHAMYQQVHVSAALLILTDLYKTCVNAMPAILRTQWDVSNVVINVLPALL
jgi:hypothetical protein